MQLDGATGAPEVNENSASFALESGVPEASEVVYTSDGWGVKEEIVLDSRPSAESIAFHYSLDASAGTTVRQDEDLGIVFESPNSDAPPLLMPPGVMVDAAGSRSSTSELIFELDAADEGWRLTLEPSMDWLMAPERVYPVRIDPSITRETPSTDCLLREGSTSSTCASTYLRAGLNSSGARLRSLLTFDISALPIDATILDASLKLYLDAAQSSGTGSAVYSLRRVGQAWSNQATWTSSAASGAWTGGNPSGAAVSSLSLSGQTSGYRTFAGLGPFFQQYVPSRQSWLGLVLKSDEETRQLSAAFFSSSSSNDLSLRPKLNIDYSVPAPEADCAVVMSSTDSVNEPSSSLSDEEYEAATATLDNGCVQYPLAETCEYDATLFSPGGCPTLSQAMAVGTMTEEEPEPAPARICKPSCGNGSSVAWIGPTSGIRGVAPSGGLPWATPGAAESIVGVIKAVATAVAVKTIAEQIADARALGVPVPNPDSATAQKYRNTRYKVYEIYAPAIPGEISYARTFKYGITRQTGGIRPEQQLSSCNAAYSVIDGKPRTCRWQWENENLMGFYTARLLEMTLAVKYKLVHGHCPIGMPRCI